MTHFAKLLMTATLATALTGTGAAQYPYPQPYPQQYPPQQYPYPGYPQNQNAVGQIIDGLIGNRYGLTDRQAIRSCGYAAGQRAQGQYGGYNGRYPRPGSDSQYPQANPGYNGQYPQAWQGYNYPGNMRVVAIDSVERRSGGLRVRGLIDTGLYRNRIRAGGDLTFRCDVNYNGYVTKLRVERDDGRRY